MPTVPTASAPCTPENCPPPPCSAVFCPPPPTDPKEYKKFVKQLEKEARKAEKRTTTPYVARSESDAALLGFEPAVAAGAQGARPCGLSAAGRMQG